MELEKKRKYLLADINGHEQAKPPAHLSKPNMLTARQEFISIANDLYEEDDDFKIEVTSITHKASLCGNCNSDKTHALDKIDARKVKGNYPALKVLERPYDKYRDWLSGFRAKEGITRQDMLRLTVEAAEERARVAEAEAAQGEDLT